MRDTLQNRDTGNGISLKWIYVVLVVLALGFGVFGYFTVKKRVRYASLE